MQMENLDPVLLSSMREQFNEGLACGTASCGARGPTLTVCAGCKIQRYCGREHQDQDWRYHKHICNKGLVDPVVTEAAA